MSHFQDKHVIHVDEQNQVIKFTRRNEIVECDHGRIQISKEDNEILCMDCKTKLNPVLWIAKYLDQLNQVTQRNNRMLAEVREIQAKLEKKNKFMCKHCHEVNTIDFKKLPSQAAVVRGMAVIDQEFDGMKVEHSR
ncbi:MULTISPECIES: hypothetical protein [Acinetobacter]|jgi:hypothetical protein|uniref:Phage-like protein n=7 Tax=Acinetobacter calcoaceticus/baumannii complex TaxID=909768 RepID=A0A0E1JMP2_ACIBA|nr:MULTISPECIES: hypothetical protein [Acinetobacter]ABS90036.2 hypothetical protein A1S_3611 [Acinetobacter baumannii ATCC 17978]AIL78019.1 hypothetical protein IX87_05010 [Acinetobacter baumannii]AIY36860.1 phage-like protein [Acinetobacter baumannii LAC-4]AJB67659.1 hypothetical protein RU84_12495 [Acinetobacter baumannii]AKQ27548.1 hypothetical protein ACX60_12565 [Acinetobacter baumannii]